MKKQTHQNDGINISRVRNSSINISGGDINNATTNINTGQGDITRGDKINTIDKTFNRLYKELEKMPNGVDKAEAQGALKKLEIEAKNGENADENRVKRWLNFLAETAPDVYQVAVETFLNPIAGIGLVFRKIAEHAKRS
jgi:hypothetical protein